MEDDRRQASEFKATYGEISLESFDPKDDYEMRLGELVLAGHALSEKDSEKVKKLQADKVPSPLRPLSPSSAPSAPLQALPPASPASSAPP